MKLFLTIYFLWSIIRWQPLHVLVMVCLHLWPRLLSYLWRLRSIYCDLSIVLYVVIIVSLSLPHELPDLNNFWESFPACYIGLLSIVTMGNFSPSYFWRWIEGFFNTKSTSFVNISISSLAFIIFRHSSPEERYYARVGYYYLFLVL